MDRTGETMKRTIRKILRSSQLAPANDEDVTKNPELELHHLQQAREGGLPGALAGNPDQKCGNSLPELQQSRRGPGAYIEAPVADRLCDAYRRARRACELELCGYRSPWNRFERRVGGVGRGANGLTARRWSFSEDLYDRNSRMRELISI